MSRRPDADLIINLFTFLLRLKNPTIVTKNQTKSQELLDTKQPNFWSFESTREYIAAQPHSAQDTQTGS